MPKKYSFPEMQCSSCPDFQRTGAELWGSRYCSGFPKKRKPKRFKSSDPKYKAPKWCPRRISPPVCRIYSFADKLSRELDIFPRNHFDRKRDMYVCLSSAHYKLRLETTLGINAKTFFERSKHGDLDDFLIETDLSLGEVVEIDDGLRPYYFYHLSWSRFVPVLSFIPSSVQK